MVYGWTLTNVVDRIDEHHPNSYGFLRFFIFLSRDSLSPLLFVLHDIRDFSLLKGAVFARFTRNFSHILTVSVYFDPSMFVFGGVCE